HAAATLYHQVNTYNVLRMAGVLLEQRPDLDGGQAARYAALADRLQETLATRFVDQQGRIYSLHVQYADGSEEWRPWGMGCDHWEHGWAVSQGPFYPVPGLQLASARLALDTWEDDKAYGYCPWNVLARSVFEHGLPSDDWAALLSDEVQEALQQSRRYPMAGALTEYHGAVESWRGLPFSAGSFRNSCAAQLLQAQAQGLAVRGGRQVQAIRDFRYRLSRIDVQASGDEEGVADYSLGGTSIRGSLLIPEELLVPGGNKLCIRRGPAAAACRIHGGDCRLLHYRETVTGCTAELRSAVPIQLRIQSLDHGRITIASTDGAPATPHREDLPGTDLSLLHIPAGTWQLRLDWGGA
ncbi:MAG: hypothetical protein ACOCXJ_08310, partial [Planctomycetota bacterium]